MNKKAVKALNQLGYNFKFESKKIHVNYLDYDVMTCSIWHDNEIKTKFKVMPDMISPHRPYPVFTYIFAIALYELAPNMTQRRAAKITRECFGLGAKQFSASTLCRARKKLQNSSAEMAMAITEFIDNWQCSENDQVTIVLNQIKNINEEYTVGAISTPFKNDKHEVSAQAAMPGKIKPALKEVFNTCPHIVEFINKYSSGKTRSREEKSRFSAYVGQLNRKFFLLNRQLLI